MSTHKPGSLGVIGGLGPLATARFFELVVLHTEAATDQEHPDIIIYNIPRIPDRTGFILGRSTHSPGPYLAKYAKKLADEGVDAIAIPCVTATHFIDEVVEQAGASVINIVDEIAEHIQRSGAKTVGIMATDGTIATGIFPKHFEKYDLACVVPDEHHQALVMKTIFKGVKAGKPIDINEFNSAAKHLTDRGCDAIVLGCT
ncbi:MAG: amino acid racemase, partial [Defluviitaleaceae bacterium]|nr:amino acid racemase [Defluviitaleaceae bacterium]